MQVSCDFNVFEQKNVFFKISKCYRGNCLTYFGYGTHKMLSSNTVALHYGTVALNHVTVIYTDRIANPGF